MGFSPRAVGKWLDEGMPATGGGRRGAVVLIEIGPALRWLLERERTSQRGAVAEESRRLKAAKARRIELENEQRAGELLSIEEATHAVQAVIVEVNSMLDGLGSRVAEACAETSNPAMVRRIINDATRDARNTAAARLEAICTPRPT